MGSEADLIEAAMSDEEDRLWRERCYQLLQAAATLAASKYCKDPVAEAVLLLEAIEERVKR